MISNELLVTTALEETWGQDEELVFLGEWCKSFKRKSVWGKRKSRTISNHWRDREKLKKDHQYLKELYERTLLALSSELNQIHNTNNSDRYWRIILGPWLLTYVAVLWDRWESTRLALDDTNIKSTLLIIDKVRKVPNDYQGAFVLFQEHVWNHQVYGSVINVLNTSNFFLVRNIENKIDVPHYDKNVKISLKHQFLNFIDFCLSKLKKKYDVVFVRSYFHPKSLFKLAFMLRQLPRQHNEFEKILEYPAPENNYRLSNCEFGALNEFERFLSNEIYKDIPIAYLEGFSGIVSKIKYLPDAEIIFTANSHFGNELFKNWCAEKVTKGVKLIVSEHGGSLNPMFSSFSHDEDIADIKTVWGVGSHIKHQRLPPNKLIGIKPIVSSGSAVTVIGVEMPLYNYRCHSAPGSSLILDDFQQKKSFISDLDDSVFGHVKVRPYPDRGWQIKERYIAEFGSEIISTFKSMDEDISNSKIIICSYPQTTFSEAMHSGVPTVLLYLEQYWEVQAEFSELIEVCKKAKIIHTDAVSAAKHVNNINSNPGLWWDDEKTLFARNMFFNVCGTVGRNPLLVWNNFFQYVLDGNYKHRKFNSSEDCSLG